MGTNYYVDIRSCPNACEHCSESKRFHLGKSSAGWRFLFYAEPEWPRDEAFAYWVRLALSGPIADEYGRECSLAELLDLAHGKADGIDHLNRPPNGSTAGPAPTTSNPAATTSTTANSAEPQPSGAANPLRRVR